MRYKVTFLDLKLQLWEKSQLRDIKSQLQDIKLQIYKK